MICGIYQIKNKENKKVYVGYACDIKRRMSHHRGQLRRNIHKNNHLQRAWNIDGEKNFEFDVLEECLKEELAKREHYWCNFLKAHNDKYGYNQKPTCETGASGHSKETLEKMATTHYERRGKPIVILNRDGKYITEVRSKGEAATFAGANRRSNANICSILKGTGNCKSWKGYIFVYKSEYDPQKNYSLEPHYRTVTKYNLNGEKIEEFSNCRAAAYSINVHPATFNKAFQGITEKIYKDYLWKLSDCKVRQYNNSDKRWKI